jgi:hypothetical protein
MQSSTNIHESRQRPTYTKEQAEYIERRLAFRSSVARLMAEPPHGVRKHR